MMSNLTSLNFEGLHELITNDKSNDVAIMDDLEGEQEALSFEDSEKESSLLTDKLIDSIHAISRGVSDETHAGYKRWVDLLITVKVKI